MRAIHLTAANFDLIRRLDGDQDGWIERDDLRQARSTEVSWEHEAARCCTPRTRGLLHRLQRRSTGRLPIALGRRRLKDASDWLRAARRLKDAFAATAGLPPVLMTTLTARVGHGDDPGHFYCKHLFYTLIQAADQPGSTIRTNEHGERLVGFLHVPADAACRGRHHPPDARTRHDDTRRVVAAALHGWLPPLLAEAAPSPVRILVTGFGPFGRIVDNPTGAFVSEMANLDASMILAFGDGVRVTASPAWEPPFGMLRVYSRGGPDPITVQVLAACLPVTDEALAPDGDRSIWSLITAFEPNAILAMGVASNAREGDYRVEHHADDANWRAGRHVPQMAPTQSMPANFALARAIQAGSQH